jgi:deazaflavin-dependent oxidoreductase (nitroreductase family)
MPLQGDYAKSAFDAVNEQVERYEATGGREGGDLQGKPCVILWTLGRKSGAIRKSPLMRVEHDGSYAVIASMGGAPNHPVWYLNLLADPHVTLQDGDEIRDYVAREVEEDERAQWWARANEAWPAYESYQERTERRIPVIVLDPE